MLTTQDLQAISTIFDQKFDEKFDKRFSYNFDLKFKEQEKNLDQKFKEQEERLDQKFDQKFKEQEERLDQKFDQKLNTKMEELYIMINDGFTGIQNQLDYLKEEMFKRPTREEIFSWADRRLIDLEIAKDRHDYLHLKDLPTLPTPLEISKTLIKHGFKKKYNNS